MAALERSYKDVLKLAYSMSDKKISEEVFIFIGTRYLAMIRDFMTDKGVFPFRIYNFVKFVPCSYNITKAYNSAIKHGHTELAKRYLLLISNIKQKYAKVKQVEVREPS